ncbi:MAG: F0F1 ATP synthase subunit epsilon [Candidatus Competibacterales bacterium]|nr:F0F1 ATP synthase subunit epsilon [Candidatus Competibacterales bacterium]
MRLLLLRPGETLIDTGIVKLVAEDLDGAFCLLPRHRDWVAALVPGILLYTDADGREQPVAVAGGTLVKCGEQVRVAVRDAVCGTDLASLRATVEHDYRRLDEQERQVRRALAGLEASALRRYAGLR